MRGHAGKNKTNTSLASWALTRPGLRAESCSSPRLPPPMMTWRVWYRSDGMSPHDDLSCSTRWKVGEGIIPRGVQKMFDVLTQDLESSAGQITSKYNHLQG